MTKYFKKQEQKQSFKSTAREYIPKLYSALRNENPNLTPDDARDRIEKNCITRG
jgi:hypothetical protein